MHSWKSMTHLVIALCFLLKGELKHSCIHGTLAVIEGNATSQTGDFMISNMLKMDASQMNLNFFFTPQLNGALLVGSSSLQSKYALFRIYYT